MRIFVLVGLALCALMGVACELNAAPSPPIAPQPANASPPSVGQPLVTTVPSATNSARAAHAALTVLDKTRQVRAYRFALTVTLGDNEGEQVFLEMTGMREQNAYQIIYKRGLFNELPGEGRPIEMILADGKTFIRGSAFFSETLPEQWYWLVNSTIVKPALDLNDLLQLIEPSAARAKAGAPEPLDGQVCETWQWDAQERAQTIINLVAAPDEREAFGVIERAEARLAGCADGFAHELSWQLHARHPKQTNSKSQARVVMRLFDFDATDVKVRPPAGALEWRR